MDQMELRPPEEKRWIDRDVDWDEDCRGEDEQSSFDYFKDWIRFPLAFSYMSGLVLRGIIVGEIENLKLDRKRTQRDSDRARTRG